MKKSLSIILCFAVVLTTFAIGFSAFAGADSLSVVSGPDKLYYLDAADKIESSALSRAWVNRQLL